MDSYPPDVDRRHEETGAYAFEQDAEGFVAGSRVPTWSVMRAGNGSWATRIFCIASYDGRSDGSLRGVSS